MSIAEFWLPGRPWISMVSFFQSHKNRKIFQPFRLGGDEFIECRSDSGWGVLLETNVCPVQDTKLPWNEPPEIDIIFGEFWSVDQVICMNQD
jgi:hypothetical protein